jgi:ATP dependent DNA ligase domain
MEFPGALSADGLEYIFPTVVSVQTKGTKKIYWTIKVLLMGAIVPGAKDAITRSAIAPVPIKAEYWTMKSGDPDMSGLRAEIRVESGLEGGVIRTVVPTFVERGRNLGRANETNVFTQALRDANGLWTKKSRGVSAAMSGPGSFEALLWPPMLASPPKGALDAGQLYLVQPKLNGVRAVAFAVGAEASANFGLALGSVIVYSRDRKLYHGMNHIRAELVALFDASDYDLGQIYFDGELYKHGASLQKVSGHARRQLSQDHVTSSKGLDIDPKFLDYMIFDCFVPEAPAMDNVARQQLLKDIWAKLGAKLEHVFLVPTIAVGKANLSLSNLPSVAIADKMEIDLPSSNPSDQINALYKKYVAQGYEGAIARLATAPYEFSNNKYHSKNLIKFKPFFEEEYTIVGLTSGTNGKAAKAIMLICQTAPGKKSASGTSFTVTPAMPIIEREELLEHLSEPRAKASDQVVGNAIFKEFYLGKPYTVRYDELSDDGVPVRARGIAVRDYE